MNKILLIIILVFLLVNPFYLFDSGLPQPADILLAIGIVIFILSGEIKKTYKIKIVKLFLRLILLITFINVFYFCYFTNLGQENNMYLAAAFYIFNFLFFQIIISLLEFSNNKKTIDIISLFIIISLSIQTMLAFLGIQGGVKEEVTSRATIFFNNPNQLGYYSLLMLSLFAALPSKYRSMKSTMLLTLVLSFYLIMYSGSRAALVGTVLLGGIMIYKEGFKIKLSSIFLISVIILMVPFILKTDFIQKKIETMEVRGERFDNTNISEAQIRGYDRFWLYPEYIFYGAGEGKNDRFKSFHQLEMHSGIGTILFSYGILGLFFFMVIVYEAIRQKIIINLLLILPIIVYNLTHFGLRDSLFWALLATIYVTTTKTISK
jgi:hypothetical protein